MFTELDQIRPLKKKICLHSLYTEITRHQQIRTLQHHKPTLCPCHLNLLRLSARNSFFVDWLPVPVARREEGEA